MVKVDQQEPIEKALRRFKKECQKAGIMSECRRREYFEKPSDRRRREAAAAKRKERRKLLKMLKKMERY